MVKFNPIWEMLKKRYAGMVRFKAFRDENENALFVSHNEAY
jgi:hypothetical protein